MEFCRSESDVSELILKTNTQKNLKQVIVFSVIGVFNTISDFIIFNVLYGISHFPLILANIIAVTLVMGVSLQLNRRYVFGNSGRSLAVHAAKFAVVTLFGLYVIQNVILFAVLGILQGMHGLTGLFANDLVQANIAKVVGVGGSAVWNFILYKLWVFREDGEQTEQEPDHL